MTRPTVVAALLLVLSGIAAAQDVSQQGQPLAFPSFTTEQNWARSTALMHIEALAGFAVAKQDGMSAATFGKRVAAIFAPGWGAPQSGSAVRLARGLQNNYRAMAGTTVELLDASDTLARLRVSRSWRALFGPSGAIYGVTIAEYDTIFRTFDTEIAAYLGLRLSQTDDSAHTTITITGRGRDAVLAFPRGATYGTTLTERDMPGRSDRQGDWQITYAPDGHFRVAKDGKPYVHGDYAVHLDEIVLSNERDEQGAVTCPGSGRYRWTVNPATGALAFGLLSDPCEPRAVVVTRKAYAKR